MKEKPLFFNNSDYDHFRDWIRLNLDGLTWQGRYEKKFEDFWEYFFVDGLSLEQAVARFEYSLRSATIGPLVSWLNWLKEKFLVYTYIFKGPSLFELAQQANMSISELACIFRNFFIEQYPHLDDYFSSVFQVGNVASENLHLKYSDIAAEMNISINPIGNHEDDVMPSMEVTLYAEWSRFLKKIQGDLYNNQLNLKSLKVNTSFKRQLKLLFEVIALLLIGGGLIFCIKEANKWYENYLVDKISFNEPQLLWLDKSLKFKDKQEKIQKDFRLDLKDLEEITQIIPKKAPEEEEEEVFETESEVVLTSWDALPKDFDVADLEQSQYEEQVKGGYKDSRFGNKSVYRVMMTSVNPQKTSFVINKLLDQYNIIQVDNVKPGQPVPGGIYYNLYVPIISLKEFLAQTMGVDESILYESRTRRRNPLGKTKVLIWIKTI